MGRSLTTFLPEKFGQIEPALAVIIADHEEVKKPRQRRAPAAQQATRSGERSMERRVDRWAGEHGWRAEETGRKSRKNTAAAPCATAARCT